LSAITQHTLDNGLTILLKEVHNAPVISWNVVYRVGSRNEPTGKTGVSHWVEHMMFKGTPKFPQGVLDKAVDRVGGQWNAFTTPDFTMYFETLPAEHIDLALEAEADRMFNAEFDPEETESERTVIISERQGAENSPRFWLGEAVRNVAFRVHGYHHEIIGDMTDLYTMSRDDLYQHYRTHYTPSNAVAVAVGAFNTDEMLKKIETFYGAVPTGDKPSVFVRPEPQQIGERRVSVERPGHTAFLKVSYRVPAATGEDWFKLEILDSVLTGPGGRQDNKTSRLYQALVKTEIATGVGGGMSETIDPYLYSINVTVRDDRTLQEAEVALLAQIDRVVADGVTQEELDKARKQARAAFAYDTESVSNQAYWLAQSAALGDVDWFNNYMGRLEAVTLNDVHDVARKYLITQARTVGWLVPTGMESDLS
jgi:zinc protease